MRLLMTTDTVGGVWTFTRELTRRMLDAGHAVALVSFGRGPSADQQAWCSYMQYVYGDAFLCRDSPAPLEWMNDNERAYEAGEEVLLDIANRFAPDLLHANQYCFGRVPLAIPRLITAHSDVLSWADACRPAGLEQSAWFERYYQLVQEGLDTVDFVVAPTGWMRYALKQHFIVSCPTEVVHNGRSVPQLVRAPHRLLRAISVGRLWDEAKGLTTLMQVRSPMPVMIAGEDTFDGAAAPAHARMQALGMLDEAGLFAAFRTSSIYIAASVYEPFGLAPLEAALCGCAVVARDIPSLREVWGEAAAYFRDAEGLQRLLGFMAEDPAVLRRAQITAMGRAQRYTAEAMAAGYWNIYDGLMRRPGKIAHSDNEEYTSHAA